MEMAITGATSSHRILMLLENNPYPHDSRVRKEAAVLTNAGYEVTVIAPKGDGQAWREVKDGVTVYRFPAPTPGSGFLGYLWEFGYSTVAMLLLSLWVLVQRGFDVIHAHNPPEVLVFIAAFYKLLGKKFVFDHHDLSPEMYRAIFGEGGNPMVYRVLLLLEKFSCKLADQIIATNQSYKQVEMERHGVPEQRISIVRNGPDLTKLRPISHVASLLRPGKTTIVYVGEMGFHDGVDYLLRALHHLIYQLGRTDVFCILVGDGDACPGLRTLCHALKLDDYIEFTGWVQFDRVGYYLSAADICVAPEPSNAYNDRSTMIKMMEYMALGKPIVAFDLPEHRRSAQESCLYAQPNVEQDFAAKIMALMDDPQRRQVMGAIGRNRIETELAWQYAAPQLLHAYQRLYATQGRELTDVAPAR